MYTLFIFVNKLNVVYLVYGKHSHGLIYTFMWLVRIVPCTQATLLAHTETYVITTTVRVTVTATVTETQTTTAVSSTLYTSTRTLVVTETPSEAVLGQSSESTGSQVAWTAVAIIFIVTTILSVTLIIIMGGLLYKRTQMMNELQVGSSGQDLSKPLPTCKSSIRYETLNRKCFQRHAILDNLFIHILLVSVYLFILLLIFVSCVCLYIIC